MLGTPESQKVGAVRHTAVFALPLIFCWLLPDISEYFFAIFVGAVESFLFFNWQKPYFFVQNFSKLICLHGQHLTTQTYLIVSMCITNDSVSLSQTRIFQIANCAPPGFLFIGVIHLLLAVFAVIVIRDIVNLLVFTSKCLEGRPL